MDGLEPAGGIGRRHCPGQRPRSSTVRRLPAEKNDNAKHRKNDQPRMEIRGFFCGETFHFFRGPSSIAPDNAGPSDSNTVATIFPTGVCGKMLVYPTDSELEQYSIASKIVFTFGFTPLRLVKQHRRRTEKNQRVPRAGRSPSFAENESIASDFGNISAIPAISFPSSIEQPFIIVVITCSLQRKGKPRDQIPGLPRTKSTQMLPPPGSTDCRSCPRQPPSPLPSQAC